MITPKSLLVFSALTALLIIAIPLDGLASLISPLPAPNLAIRWTLALSITGLITALLHNHKEIYKEDYKPVITYLAIGSCLYLLSLGVSWSLHYHSQHTNNWSLMPAQSFSQPSLGLFIKWTAQFLIVFANYRLLLAISAPIIHHNQPKKIIQNFCKASAYLGIWTSVTLLMPLGLSFLYLLSIFIDIPIGADMLLQGYTDSTWLLNQSMVFLNNLHWLMNSTFTNTVAVAISTVCYIGLIKPLALHAYQFRCLPVAIVIWICTVILVTPLLLANLHFIPTDSQGLDDFLGYSFLARFTLILGLFLLFYSAIRKPDHDNSNHRHQTHL